ncbi:cytochrome o ubiquinol oxidase subunit IV [Tardiphaga sp. vice352]|jgi:cytochrome o ubiquinol oxidase operon protein cyoD|uniref:cytochrome o ubiquinol oxidase subunit IV n=1 Tax=unclassified Tardiphaga TaxID=2631404 RepID=UPI001164F0E5|nr:MULTISPECIES: cytochrome o ubiquinol oxidase subunit IV [unclassified Tardiphaga]MBC7583018.1 cytochrome o ubiquinol oxidase subunit IV [Tardiphaga sp.]QDM15574.1 cytochrome o ubiquinol oxidase subunit IV [Tardiphaga sp. vice278]QDM20637.1 cytochrome o ubiquinol oxidase subunit IV [Tardiphaga sp. vice154]QDM25771.1 cytochrome o ubiquinol oxidase subunit IV [Tardiphaga sp. vice304]QDM30973.1 cytochrome o ubiquinol oxidase subunit IV [Tardiphaga sp. vice352]
MTAHDTPNAAAHGDTHHDDGAAHGSRRDYIVGFVLSVILTAIPFWLVMSGTIENKQVTAFIVMAFALVQIVVHMVYFLHMNSKSEGGWTVMAMIFTVIVIVIALSGSLWVMYHLNTNMMPTMSPEAMKNMP